VADADLSWSARADDGFVFAAATTNSLHSSGRGMADDFLDLPMAGRGMADHVSDADLPALHAVSEQIALAGFDDDGLHWLIPAA
jgi:hypothetical protein